MSLYFQEIPLGPNKSGGLKNIEKLIRWGPVYMAPKSTINFPVSLPRSYLFLVLVGWGSFKGVVIQGWGVYKLMWHVPHKSVIVKTSLLHTFKRAVLM